MKRLLKDFILTISPKKLRNLYTSHVDELLQFGNISFAQEGEDILLNRIFNGKNNGYYIDIGAHHPLRFSNTYFFYLRGWRGINIDAMPGSMDAFRKIRPLDINIEAPISNIKEELTYYIFNEPALNTFDSAEAEKKNGVNNFKVIETRKLKTERLDEILRQYLSKEQDIDFMSIDVEGLDYQVLQSNDWSSFRPKIILVEELKTKGHMEKSDVERYLNSHGYEVMAKTFNTIFFKLK